MASSILGLPTGNITGLPAVPIVPMLCCRCNYPGSDIRLKGCGCQFHTRCLSIPADPPLTVCSNCNQGVMGIHLLPMSFAEVDAAKKRSDQDSDSKRRKSKGDATAADFDASDCRTGRWTQQETAYVDEIIRRFEMGMLPVCNGIKLNDFLAGILQCKQSRLTKKMKNAKLSARSFVRTSGYLDEGAKEFSEMENCFYGSIINETARAEVRFHMQKEWRELFSNLCSSIGQPLDADDWLSSVEELERRLSLAKDAARHKRRKLMMKFALGQDNTNLDRGAFIDYRHNSSAVFTNGTSSGFDTSFGMPGDGSDDMFNLAVEKTFLSDSSEVMAAGNTLGQMVLMQQEDGFSQARKMQQPHGQFIGKIISYIQRKNAQNMNYVPFEYVDLWVPSFVSPKSDGQQSGSGNGNSSNDEQKCRLCFAGCGTIDPSCLGKARLDEYYNLLAFGEYSQKFSFAVGRGLPGRVYQSGIPTWEQSVHNAPVHHFERCGGALQYGVKTVVGIPIPSPNVGCIVVVLYSCHDRSKDQNLVGQLSEEFASYLPNPKWKLVVDAGPESSISQLDTNAILSNNVQQNNLSNDQEKRIHEVIQILGEHMPSDPSSPLSAYTPGYMSLRLMLLKSVHTDQESEWMRILLGSYSSYASAGRSSHDIAALLARDFMFLQQQSQQNATQYQNQNQQNSLQFQQQSNVQMMQNGMQPHQMSQMLQNSSTPSYFSMSQQQNNNQFFPMSCPQQPQHLTSESNMSTRASFEAPRTLITE